MKSNFEKKYGKYAIKNLTVYLIAFYVIGYIMELVNPEMCSYFSLDPYMILHGQVWRIVTWLLMPPESLSVFTIIMLLLYYNLGTTLEKTWGTYRYNVYLFSGFLFTIVGAFVIYGVYAILYPTSTMLTGSYISALVNTYYINLTIFLVFAVTYPDMELLLYFVLPVKMKWFGILYVAFIAYDIYRAFAYYPTAVAIIQTLIILVSLLNFLIFWLSGKFKVGYVHGGAKRKKEFKKQVKTASKERFYADGAKHKCVVCGRTDETNPELTFRYCSKCYGGKEYCQDHLFTHEHR